MYEVNLIPSLYCNFYLPVLFRYHVKPCFNLLFVFELKLKNSTKNYCNYE